MIRRLTVEHFKSIERLDLPLGRMMLLVGPNSSGKSNVIDAIRFIKDAVSYDLDRAVSDRHGIDSIRQWSPSRPYHVSISLNMDSRAGTGHFSVTLGSAKGHYRIIREEAVWSETVHYLSGDNDEDTAGINPSEGTVETTSYTRDREGRVNLRYDRNFRTARAQEYQIDDRDELFIQSTRSSVRGLPIRGLLGLRRALTSFEAYSIFSNTLRTPQTPSNDQRLSSSGNNLTSVFKSMPRSRRGMYGRSEVIAALRLIIPNLENITIQSIGGLAVPTFRVREPGSKTHDFNVSQISDGTLRVLGILVSLYQPNAPETIALEEPEQNVNPGVLAVLADAIREASS